MDVEIESPAEALDDRHAAGLAAAPPASARVSSLEGKEGTHVDPEHGAAQGVILGHEVAKAVGQAQHPLADRDARQHVIDEARGST